MSASIGRDVRQQIVHLGRAEQCQRRLAVGGVVQPKAFADRRDRAEPMPGLDLVDEPHLPGAQDGQVHGLAGQLGDPLQGGPEGGRDLGGIRAAQPGSRPPRLIRPSSSTVRNRSRRGRPAAGAPSTWPARADLQIDQPQPARSGGDLVERGGGPPRHLDAVVAGAVRGAIG
jgi:hypothetical protein